MEDYSNLLETIKSKTHRLVDEHKRLKQEYAALEGRNSQLQNTVNQQAAQLKDLEDRMKVLKLAKAVSTEGKSEDTTELKKKINEYIKEIEKCVALLNT